MNYKIYLKRSYFIISVLIIYIFCNSNVVAKEELKYDLQKDDLALSEIMQELIPLVLDGNKFNDLKNHNLIKNNLNKLEQIFSNIVTYQVNIPITFKISVDVIGRQIKAAKRAFYNQDYVYARFLLKSLPAACIAYYSQEDHNIHNNLPEIHKELFVSDFDLAEFYYIIRAYIQALSSYNDFIVKNINKDDIGQNLQTALERILAIYLQKDHNPKLAINLLKDYQSKFVFPEYINIYITEWLKGLEHLEVIFKDKARSKNHLTFNELKKYIDKHFHNAEALPPYFIIPKSDQMFYLMLSGYLNDYLYDAPKKEEIPALLYWASLCDRALSYHDNISVADLYLKECIIMDPKSKYAKKCLAEYDEYITLSYSGNSTEIPEYILKEIAFLRELVDPPYTRK